MKSLIDQHRERHEDFMEILANIRTFLISDHLTIKINAKAVYEMLLGLSRLVQFHLSGENHNIYNILITHQNAMIRGMAWCFIDSEKPIRRVFESHYNKWLNNCTFNFTGDFITETLNMLDMLERHIQLEKYILLPKVEDAINLYGQPRSQVSQIQGI